MTPVLRILALLTTGLVTGLVAVAHDDVFEELAWVLEGHQDQARFGAAVAGVGDVNGDGYRDVLVSAPYYDHDQEDEGRVELFLGSAQGLETTPAWHADGDQEGARFGLAVAGAGDVNGDGFDDIIVGTRFYDFVAPDEGGAFLFLGSPDGPSASADWSFGGGRRNAAFGIAVAGAGDVDGDGLDDVIVGASNYDDTQTDEGRVFLFLGTPAGLSRFPAWTADGNAERVFFGRSVAGVGDVNGDGCGDIVVGAPEFSARFPHGGRAFLFLGSTGGPGPAPDWIYDGDQASEALGRPVAGAGDVNGDGFDDVIVGARRHTSGEPSEGRALVFLGSAEGLEATPTWSAEGNQGNALFGAAVAGVGDVDGDGFDDVLVGAPRRNDGFGSEGRAYLYPGSPAGPALAAVSTIPGGQFGAHLGEALASAGDIDGDGSADLLIAAPEHDGDSDAEGLVRIYAGLPAVAARTAPPPARDFIRGDANGDRRVEVLDAIAVLRYLSGDATAPPCEDAADADDSGALDLADGVSIIGSAFLPGSPLAAPFPACGIDPTDDDLGCASHPCGP